ASAKLCVDETPTPVLDPGRGRTKPGYFWALSRDDRPWAGPDPPGVVYAYALGRGAVHGLRLLEGYRGIIHCDGYEAYKTMTRTTRGRAVRYARLLLVASTAPVCEDRARGCPGTSSGCPRGP